MRETPGHAARQGERWAYRTKDADELTEVEVLRIGTRTPLRLLVRFLSVEWEGHEDWVPPSRLKILWGDRGRLIERERRWAAVRALSPWPHITPSRAAGKILYGLPNWDFAAYGHKYNNGLLLIDDLDGLLVDLDLDRERIAGHRLCFYENDQLVAPWPVTEIVVRRLAEKYAYVLLPLLDQQDLAAEKCATLGFLGCANHNPQICAEIEAEERPVRDLVREWCGQEASERIDEIAVLQAEVLRLATIAENAITALRKWGRLEDAERLERDLEIPIELIRAQK